MNINISKHIFNTIGKEITQQNVDWFLNSQQTSSALCANYGISIVNVWEMIGCVNINFI